MITKPDGDLPTTDSGKNRTLSSLLIAGAGFFLAILAIVGSVFWTSVGRFLEAGFGGLFAVLGIWLAYMGTRDFLNGPDFDPANRLFLELGDIAFCPGFGWLMAGEALEVRAFPHICHLAIGDGPGRMIRRVYVPQEFDPNVPVPDTLPTIGPRDVKRLGIAPAGQL